MDQLTLMMIDGEKVIQEDLNTMDYRIYSFKNTTRRYNRCE